jgi:hypothetical protein
MVLEGTYDDDFFTVGVFQNNQIIGNTVELFARRQNAASAGDRYLHGQLLLGHDQD